MKTYQRKTPLFSMKLMFFTLLITTIFSFFVYHFNGAQGCAFIILVGFSCVLFFVLFLLILSTMYRYLIKNNFIKMYFAMIPYKYISTNDIRCIIISNAIYNSSKCDGNIADIPMCFKKKDNDGTPKKIQYPYISLICGDQPFTIKRGMNSRQLLYMGVDKVISLGICWEQAFKELVQQTDAPIYILGESQSGDGSMIDKIR